jgi:hypothetical protein
MKSKKMSTPNANMGKEYNKNAGNKYRQTTKFVGCNASLSGKVFEITAKNAAYQCAETIKAIADYVRQEYTHRGDV